MEQYLIDTNVVSDYFSASFSATALAYGYTLITSNEKDFANIKGLKIINPHKV